MENVSDTIKEMKRPTLADPKEFTIVKSVYFPKDNSFDEKEIAERIERAQSKRRNLNNIHR